MAMRCQRECRGRFLRERVVGFARHAIGAGSDEQGGSASSGPARVSAYHLGRANQNFGSVGLWPGSRSRPAWNDPASDINGAIRG